MANYRQRPLSLAVLTGNVLLFIATLISVVAMLSGCDDRFEFLNRVNRTPELTITRQGVSSEDLSLLTDAVKISLKHNNLPFEIVLHASDQETKLTSISYRFVTGNGSLLQGGQDLGGTIGLLAGSATVLFQPGDVGRVVIEFWVADDFGKKAIAKAELNVFLNLGPVSKFNFDFVGTHGPYEYRLDAGESFDQDNAQGGGIQAYRFIINDTYEILSSQPVVIHNFEGPGPERRDVKLEVIDNDGQKSALFPLVVK